MISHRLPITVRLESFEGPLDLLLYLIQSNELDLSRVSISRITDQYLNYVRIMQELDFDVASEFLVMAATLLHWKSRSLLPKEEVGPGQDPTDSQEALTQEELLKQLIEHQKYQAVGRKLGELPLLGLEVFSRANQKPPIEKIWREMNITDLAISYQQLLIRSRKRVQVLRKETVSISDKIQEFSERLTLNQRIQLQSLLSDFPSRGEIVATFLATLELSRLKKMKLYQEEVYSTIFLELIESLRNFDLKLASGFEPETPSQAQNPSEALNP